MFGEVVADVFTSSLPVDKEVTLSDTVPYPVEPRVYYLGTFLIDSVIHNSGSTLVVCLYMNGRLVMTKLIGGGANGDCLFCIEEEYLKLCFHRRCKNIIDDGEVDMDGTIDR